MSIQEIKSQISMSEVLQHYGLKPDKNRMLNCPFHEDKKPSMQYYADSNTVYCFSGNCDLSGKSIDQIDFILHKEDCTKREAIEKAKQLAGVIDSPREESLDSTFEILKKNLHKSINAKKYLENRKIYDLKIKAGFNRNTIKELRECVVFPLKDKYGKIVSFYGRSIKNNQNGGHYYTTNRSGLYPNYPSKETKILILTESIIDVLSIKMHTKYQVLALYGTNGFNNEHREAIKAINNLEEVILFFDGDEAGIKAAAKYSKEIYRILPEIKISMVNTPEDEDANSIVQKGEFDLEDLLNKRSAVYNELEPEKALEKPLKIVKFGHLDVKNSEYPQYIENNIHITVIGGINLYPVDKLKVTLKLSKIGSYNPLHTIREKLDLYSDEEIEKLVRKIGDRLGASSKELQIMLLNLAEELENHRSEQIELQKPKKIEKRKLTKKRKEVALKWLKKPNLLKRTNELIGKSGVVGEEKNRLLMYLIFTSRLREQPLHIMSLGSSGTGKTYLQERISELIPEDQKLEITTLSENALYYFEREELKHKLVLIEDLDGANDDKVLYAIRELMSKKRISKTIPIKDAKGNLKTITLQV